MRAAYGVGAEADPVEGRRKGRSDQVCEERLDAAPAYLESVAVLCPLPVSPTSTTPCPSGSKVGSGQAVAKVQGVGQLTSPLTLYLAKPHHQGDIASIVL